MNGGSSTARISDDFPVTRRVIERLDEWLMALASPLLPLQQIPAGPPDAGGFQWRFREQTERALCVGKAVRRFLDARVERAAGRARAQRPEGMARRASAANATK